MRRNDRRIKIAKVNPAAGLVVIPRCPPGPGVPDNPE